ncbi:MAG: diguanylate cyclase [Candidatus Omnitrophica bacterium]|nr:diguanylate cyclase [Candidatus Omnitrophota bacterium]
MTAALMKMRAKAENANPLTKLPGNIVIHDEIDNRIKAKTKFAVIYSDLDNFKAFNDKYGIGLGDQAIKLTADILKESLKHGNSDDLLGHEGGDDFVMITTPDKTKTITDYICKEFDKRIRQFYSKEDLDQGFIMASSRDSQIKKFPIMTISLAGVTNEQRPIQSYAEVTNICAEVKKKAKSLNISSFVLDKRA